MIRQGVILAVLAVGGHAALAQNVIVNGTFDTDIAGWETTTASTGVAEWEPVLGQPPGALRMVGPDELALTTECYPAVPGRYLLRADGYMRTAGDDLFCSIDWALYSEPDCSDSFAIYVVPLPGSWVVNPNQWESLENETSSHPVYGGFGTSTRGIRPFLNKVGDFMGDDACVFDNVYLEIQPVAVAPVLGPVGLAMLAVLTAGAGFVVLRRR